MNERLFHLLSFVYIVAARLQKEEAVMSEKFGEQYQRYMQRTGRFLPRWRGISL
jgi:protein-S-isoprenylcysteine O-methyltransferase Ste14